MTGNPHEERQTEAGPERGRGATLAQFNLPGTVVRRRALPEQVRDSIAELVISDLRPGDVLPTETAVAEWLMVSRSTVREAMKLLEQEGLVETRRGMGRFATALSGLRPERPMTRFESITNMMNALGFHPTTKVISVVQRPPSIDEIETFGLSSDMLVIETRRLRLLDGKACLYSVNILDPRTLDTDVEDIEWNGSVVTILEGMDHEIVASSAHISVVTGPTGVDALDYVALPVGPWLLVTEQCVTRTGRCVLLSRDYHHGDIFSFSVIRRRSDAVEPAGNG
jgi:GntR family transcriptional regulator